MNELQDINEVFFQKRYEQIRDFERTIYQNGTKVIKFMLHLSKDEQKRRFLDRIKYKEKNWKFSSSDLKERRYWDEYQKAFEDALSNTSTENSPWYIIPCDYKATAQNIMSEIIVQTLEAMNPQFPKVSEEEENNFKKAYEELLNE